MFSYTSYACNAQVFDLAPRLSSVTDGLSNTILLAEHYVRCANCEFTFTIPRGLPRRSKGYSSLLLTPATFADGGPLVRGGRRNNCRDYYPITFGTPPVSEGAGGVTFQVQAPIDKCDPRLPNASSASGLQVALADGSVRIVGPRVSPTVFWSAVTPNRGEVFTLD